MLKKVLLIAITVAILLFIVLPFFTANPITIMVIYSAGILGFIWFIYKHEKDQL